MKLEKMEMRAIQELLKVKGAASKLVGKGRFCALEKNVC